ncbi:MAG: UDP-glucose 4-epimerase GalE [Acidimicrobiia bacterium]
MTVLVTGGAGFIGGVVTDQLRAGGKPVVVIDDLSRGHRDVVDDDVPFYRATVGDRDAITRIVADHEVDACIHFAGLIAVGESVAEPGLYWRRNVAESITLFDTLSSLGVDNVVFSSSAAVYGDPIEVPIPEAHPKQPTSPYGNTKLVVEQVLEDLSASGQLQAVSLRYFNAAGASERRRERHIPETHLIPLALRAARDGTPMNVFGTDYPTPDGTAIRDYIHVTDLASAHVRAIDYLRSGGATVALNLGVGHGASVREVLTTSDEVPGRSINAVETSRRPGDPAVLGAAADEARSVLQWTPHTTDLAEIVESAWRWEKDGPPSPRG